MKRLLLGVVLLLGCGPADRTSVPHASVRWMHADHLTPSQRARLLDAWEHHRRTWATNRGRPAPHVETLEIWGTPLLPQGTMGWAQWTTGTIQLVVGSRLELPWAYHELQHMDVHDERHVSPEWTTWDQEQASSVIEWLRRNP